MWQLFTRLPHADLLQLINTLTQEDSNWWNCKLGHPEHIMIDSYNFKVHEVLRGAWALDLKTQELDVKLLSTEHYLRLFWAVNSLYYKIIVDVLCCLVYNVWRGRLMRPIYHCCSITERGGAKITFKLKNPNDFSTFLQPKLIFQSESLFVLKFWRKMSFVLTGYNLSIVIDFFTCKPNCAGQVFSANDGSTLWLFVLYW